MRREPGSREFQKHFENQAHRYEKLAFEGSISSRIVNIREQELVKSMYRESFSNKKKILDIGAGNGRWSNCFYRWGAKFFPWIIHRGCVEHFAILKE